MKKFVICCLGVILLMIGSLKAQPGIIYQIVDLDTINRIRADLIKNNTFSYNPHIIKIDSNSNLDNLVYLEDWEDLSLQLDLVSVPERFRSLNMSRCKNLSVNGGNLGLKNIKALQAFPALETLSVNYYWGESLPQELNSLPKLSSIYIGNAPHLQELEVLGSMKNIEHLNLNELPSLRKLPVFAPSNHISTLNLSLSDSCELDFLSSVPRLTYLNLEGSKLSSFSNTAFSKLEEITLSRCRNLSSISGLSKAINLVKLSLYDTDIREITGDFSALHLKRLEIRDNQQLQSVSALKSMGSIEELTIMNSPKLLDLGPELWQAKIRKLYLSNLSKLKDIESIIGIKNLIHLSINATGLEGFPDHFKRLGSLSILEIHNNLDLKDLGALAHMQNMVHLHISDSPLIKEIPSIFSTNQSLKSATFELKNLETIEGLVGLSALESLSIIFEHEQLTLPAELYQSYQLRSVFLDGPIRDISPLMSLPQLASVNLKDAQIQIWPKGFYPSSIILNQTNLVDLSGLDCSKLSFLQIINNPDLERVPSRESLEMIQNLLIRRNLKLKIAPYTTTYKWRIMENDDQ